MRDISIMIDDVKFNYRVGVLIENTDEILVECCPEFDFVVLPGGRVKTLENSIEALQREIKEEMGVKIEEKELEKKAIIENFFEFEKTKCHELFFIYKLNINYEDKRFKNVRKNIDSKTNYYKWVKKDKLKGVKLLPNVLIDVIKSNEFEIISLNALKKIV